jgi:hypothetical protein
VARFSPLTGSYAVNVDVVVATYSGEVLCHAVANSARSGHNTSSTNVAREENPGYATLGMTGGMIVAPGSTIQVYCEASRSRVASGNSNLLVFKSLAITATQVATRVDAPDHAARVRAKPLNSFVQSLALPSRAADKSRAGGSYTAPGLTDRSRGARP